MLGDLPGKSFLLVQVACDLYLPTVTANLVDKGIIGKNLPYIWQTGGKMLLVSALGLLATFGNIYFASHQAMQVGQRLRAMLFAKVLTFSDEEISRFGQSSLITRTTNDVVQVQMTFMQLLRMLLQSPIMLVAGTVLAYIQQPRLAKFFAIALPVLAAIILLLMHFAMPLFKSIQQKTDRINLIFREGLTGVWVIRAFRQDQREQDRFAGANLDYTKKAYTIISLMQPAVTLVLSLTNVGIVFLGSRLISGRIMEIGSLLTFLTYAPRAQKLFGRQQEQLGKINGQVEEIYAGVGIVRVFGQEENEEKTFAKHNDSYFDASWKAGFLSIMIFPLMNFVKNVGYLLIAVFGVIDVINGAISLGNVQAFLQYSNQFSQPLTQLANMSSTIQQTIASAERIFAVLDAEDMDETVHLAEGLKTDTKLTFKDVFSATLMLL